MGDTSSENSLSYPAGKIKDFGRRREFMRTLARLLLDRTGLQSAATNQWRVSSLPPLWILSFSICVSRTEEAKPGNSPRTNASGRRGSLPGPRGRRGCRLCLVRQKASLYWCGRVSEDAQKGSFLQINSSAASLPSVRAITSRSAFSASP